MKIGVAQIKPGKGDIDGNIAGHKRLIDLAVSNKADAIFFPELSLTGYEPTLAYSLAMEVNDHRLNDFQQISNQHNIVIGVGVPTQYSSGICISLIIFQPHLGRRVYSKKYLHPDEEDFFIHGENFSVLEIGTTKVALAICYEISVAAHSDDAFKNGSEIYLASVAKFERGIEPTVKRLEDLAVKHAVSVLMSNSIGFSDGELCAGKSSVWNNRGELLAQLDDQQEGIIVLDTTNLSVVKSVI